MNAERGRLLAAALVAALIAPGPGPAVAREWELRVCADPDALPFSNRAGEGFDDRIAALLAEELAADLHVVWLPDTRGRTRLRFLQSGACDLVMGMLEGAPGALTSHAYYRTGYVFVYPEDAGFEVASLDDPALRDLRVGFPGGARKTVPPALALARRGAVENQRHFPDRAASGEPFPPVLRALEDGEVDLAVVWGPVAARFAREVGGMSVVPVRPEIDVPFVPMVASLAVGMRPGDEALRDEVDLALSRIWDDVQGELSRAGVPLIPLPRPVPSLAEAGR